MNQGQFGGPSYYIPHVIETTGRGVKSSDIYTRLLEDRIVFIGTPIDDGVANAVVAQLLFLGKDISREISVYINSPGGSVTAGLAIYDTMQFVKSPVATYCIGQAASMGAVLLCAGRPGKRYSLPNSRIMIHQPWGGAQGTASDIVIQAEEIVRLKGRLNEILALHCKQPVDKVKTSTDRDFFMSSAEAKEFGLVDHVVTTFVT